MEKLRANKLLMDEDFQNNELKRENVAAIFVGGCYVWPKVNKTITVTDLFYENTIYLSLINDKHLVIVPDSKLDCVGTIVELVNCKKIDHHNALELEVVGIKRFNITKFFRATLENIVRIIII